MRLLRRRPSGTAGLWVGNIPIFRANARFSHWAASQTVTTGNATQPANS
jgi:hypothetical protein